MCFTAAKSPNSDLQAQDPNNELRRIQGHKKTQDALAVSSHPLFLLVSYSKRPSLPIPDCPQPFQ
ncbi:hypothetical protein KSP39_PZI007820 [Platanthera zijinensis]|uniref:Uncharacterized protein n=1 Tax=Platanthera zijinensis TaxID=2320716 RepID=A0AAP0BPJ0_9ASPA